MNIVLPRWEIKIFLRVKRLHLARDLMGQILILFGYRFHNCKTRDLIRILYNIDNITEYINTYMQTYRNIVHAFRKVFHFAKSLCMTFSHFHDYIRRALKRDFLPPSRAILNKGLFDCLHLVEKPKETPFLLEWNSLTPSV